MTVATDARTLKVHEPDPPAQPEYAGQQTAAPPNTGEAVEQPGGSTLRDLARALRDAFRIPAA